MNTVEEPKLKEISFEEALVKTEIGKFNYAIILVCGIASMGWFYEVMGLGYYLPVAECDLSMNSNQDYAIISGACNSGLILSYYLWGFLSDKVGRRNILIKTSLLSLLFTLLSSVTSSFWIFTALRFFNAFFISSTSSVIFAYMAEFHSEKHRAWAILMSSSVFGVVGILLPFAAYLIVNLEWNFYIPVLDVVFKPWRLFVLFCGSPSLIGLICLYFLPESPKFVYNTGDEVRCIKILQSIHKINTGNLLYPVSKIVDSELGEIKNTKMSDYIMIMWKDINQLMRKPLLKITSILCFLQFGSLCFNCGMLLYFPKILHDTHNYEILDFSNSSLTVCEIQNLVEPRQNQIFNATCIDKMDFSSFTYPMLTELAFAVFFFVFGYLIKVVDTRILANIIFGMSLLSSIFLVFNTNIIFSKIAFILIFLAGVNSGVILTTTVDAYPTKLRSSAVGISMIFGRLGTICGTYMVGYFLDYHCNTTFILNIGMCILCMIITILIPRSQAT